MTERIGDQQMSHELRRERETKQCRPLTRRHAPHALMSEQADGKQAHGAGADTPGAEGERVHAGSRALHV